MAVKIAVGISESFDPVEAFSEAGADAAAGLDGPCDLCLVFAGAPHLGRGKWILSVVHEVLAPRHLIGCGAGGVVGPGREIEEGPAAVVWAASMPGGGGNVIQELASKPAIERLREALAGLDPWEQQLAASGLMLGIVIDENRPEYRRGDFLVRPIIGVDAEAGTIAVGERVRLGQT